MFRIKYVVIGGFLVLFSTFVSSYVVAQQSTTSQCIQSISCSAACGQAAHCISNGCGSVVCCPATPACCTKTCTTGTMCYQPPMPSCPTGMACAQYMPSHMCVTPTPVINCTLRSKGDANCDGAINVNDFTVFKTQLLGSKNNLLVDPNPTSSADFNNDGKVNLVDYEIWRNAVYK